MADLSDRRNIIKLSSGQSALLELGILFLPGLPAMLWLWPHLRGTEWNTPVQVFACIYLMAGALFIGLRRWNWEQLGLNRRGLGYALAFGAPVILGRILVVLGTSIPLAFQFGTLERTILEILYYLFLIGLGEELIFRGLMYRALDEWRGTRWAIWGSSLVFGIFHLGNGEPTVVVAVFVGALFAAIRRRTGSIAGLAIVHGLYDLSTIAFMPDWSVDYLITHVQINSWFLIVVGYAMMIGTGIFLWKAPQGRDRCLGTNSSPSSIVP